MCCQRKTQPVKKKQKHSSSLMKDRLVIKSHYWVAGQRPQTFLLTKHTHTVVVNFQFFCFLCSFCGAYFFCTHLRDIYQKKWALYSLFNSVFFHMCLFFICRPLSAYPLCVSVSLTADGWLVVRQGLSALLNKPCFKSVLQATGSAFKYSHLTHPNRGS